MTTRQGSSYLDSKGIDIMNIDYAIQCKRGYKNINYAALYAKISKKLEFAKISLPIIILHKYKNNTNLVISIRTFVEFVKRGIIKYERGVLKNKLIILDATNILPRL